MDAFAHRLRIGHGAAQRTNNTNILYTHLDVNDCTCR